MAPATACAPLRVGSRLASGRLQVQQVLGRGGMGVVYRAFDVSRRSHVALKTMSRLDAGGIYALKNEFRALMDVHHPNLARLFELFHERELWFFTMELVAGVHFDAWVRPEGRFQEHRARAAFDQLLDAIGALHARGKLHRDIKPSNTLVTPSGHVVVLDFGLVAEPGSNARDATLTEESIVGTPAYLAPEQALGEPASAASDIYALGVMLFEALTGRLPFEGTGAQVLIAKQFAEPAWPADARRDMPRDLVVLCDQLLARDPKHRPALDELRKLFVKKRSTRGSAELSIPPQRMSTSGLVGRAHEIDSMRAAYRTSLTGRTVVFTVSGDSGIGKSTLCHALLDELIHEAGVVALRGRCNEQESVPFKALDALVDDLSRKLRRMPPVEATALLPRDAAALMRLFPVLGRVDAFAHAPMRPLGDPHTEQRRAFEALHELLGRMCDRSPLILLLDDLQWMDRDSSQLLRYLLMHADALPVLFIMSYRTALTELNERLDAVLEAAACNRATDLRQIALSPLTEAASTALAYRTLTDLRPEASALAERVGHEARGNPLLIHEYSRFLLQSADLDMTSISLGVALDARLHGLSPAARKLVSLLAVAGVPLSAATALAAARAAHADIDALHGAHLTRWTHFGKEKKLELYHDQIRARFNDCVDADARRTLFADLARASAGRDVDPEMRCAFFEGAGDTKRAAACASKAADQAAASLAFDHAAHLYQKALDLGEYGVRTGLRLTTSWADALANAGRCDASAAAYERASLIAHGYEHLELQRRSAEQLLISGQIRSGMTRLDRVSHSLGLGLIDASPAQLDLDASLAASRGRIRAPRAADDRRGALRLELFHTTVLHAAWYAFSPANACDTALEYLREAERRGDTKHVVWALGAVATHMEASADGLAILARMHEVAIRDGRPELRAQVHWLRGFLARRSGEHRSARNSFAKALTLFRDCVGAQWYVDIARIFDQTCANLCGDYADLSRSAPMLADDAFERGRVWTGTALSSFWGMPAWMVRDASDEYRRRLKIARQRWAPLATCLSDDATSFGLDRAEVMTSLYDREPLRGLHFLERADTVSNMLKHRSALMLVRGLCAAAALGAQRSELSSLEDPQQLRALVQDSVSHLNSSYTQPFAHMLRAALALSVGDLETAARALGTSLELFEAASYAMLAAGTRRRLGQLLGGDAGKSHVSAAEAFMQAQGVVNIESLTEMLCPGCESDRTAISR